MNIVQTNIHLIKKLCKRYHVVKLYVFGSTLSGKIHAKSDVDLLVQFEDVHINDYADNYFEFKFSLEDILNRKVDLLEDHAIKNPYLRRSIDANKQLLYG